MSALKKTFGKIGQWTGEKLNMREGTKLDEDFKRLEQGTDATKDGVEILIRRTEEYLQPNPVTRGKLAMLGKGGKKYPQPEGELGDSMIEKASALGEESAFGQALIEAGEVEKRLAEARDALDTEVLTNFITPMKDFLEKDVKEVMAHRKKLESRRLDYDAKKRSYQEAQAKNKVTPQLEQAFQEAERKFEESKLNSYNGMLNVLENDVEQIAQLKALVEAQFAFHNQCVQILSGLAESLDNRVHAASQAPKRERMQSMSHHASGGYEDDHGYGHGGYGGGHAAQASMGGGKHQARALYEFVAENPGELTFREGEVITIISRLDENWLQGECRGQIGMFPSSYVENPGV
eukprot:Colp12_sorted_trinity150504_noHs@11013